MSLIDGDVAAIADIDAIPAILDVICRTTGMGYAIVARVGDDCWTACAVRDEIAVGVGPGQTLAVGGAICDAIRRERRAVVFDDVASAPGSDGRGAPAHPAIRSCVSVPIVLPGDEFFGALCSIDTRAIRADRPETVPMFHLFADLIGHRIDARRRLAASRAMAADERERAELREQIIAVLGHDLRNPLAAIGSGARLLQGTPLNDRAKLVVGHIGASVERMSVLIDNVLDFARGRLGGGFSVQPSDDEPLAPTLTQVTSQMRGVHPERQIELMLRIDQPVSCDPVRVGQALSHLLENALSHGDPKGVIRVDARTTDSEFLLTVTNPGQPIPPGIIEHLFKPFFRAPDRSNQHGLGLGLYITSEIARAHEGTLDVRSDGGETCFTFRFPLRPDAPRPGAPAPA